MHLIAKTVAILKSERFKIIFGEILSFLFLLFGTVAIPNLLFYIPRLPFYSRLLIGEHNDIIEIGTALVIMPLLFFSLVYSCTENYRLMYKYKQASAGTPKSKLSFVLSHPVYYIKCSVFAAIYLTTPLSKLYAPLYAVIEKLDLLDYEVYAILFVLAVLFILSLLAKFFAVWKWEKETEYKKPKPFAAKNNLIKNILVFTLGGSAINIFVPMLIKLAPIAGELMHFKITKAVLCIIVLVIVMSYARALNKRRKCLKKLYKLCTGRNRRCEKVKRAYLSVLFPSYSVPFEIKIGDKTFSCKLISGRRLYTRMRISEEGYGEYVFPVKIMGITLFELRSTIYFEIDSPHKKVIIFNPSPHYIYVETNNIQKQIDNGARVGEYKIYNTIAFLNSIERDCFGK